MTARFLLLAIFFGSALLHAAEYRFTLNGTEVDPKILPVVGERKGAYAPGDIGHLHGFPFVLGKPGHYQFRVGGVEDTKLFSQINTDPEHCIAVRVRRIGYGDEAKIVNPLREMPAENKAMLRGIRFPNTPAHPDWKTITSGINWERCALSVRYNHQGDEDAAICPLPPDLHYLEFASGSDELEALKLTKLSNLRYLAMEHVYDLDLNAFRNASQLRNLDLSHCELRNTDALANLTNVRFLKIRDTKGLENVTFSRKMPHLRVFKIDYSAVTDLRPVGACPNLRLLSATGAQVEHLPDPAKLPLLRDLRLLSTPVSYQKELIASFRKSSPQCMVRAGWHELLLSKLGKIDRLRIRTGEIETATGIKKEKTHFEIKDTEKIEALLQSLKIDEERSGSVCMCAGDPWLEFYRGVELIATLAFHHGESLRWSRDYWPGDAELTPDSAELLCDVLADGGVLGPREDLDYKKKMRMRSDRHWTELQKLAPEAWLRTASKISDQHFNMSLLLDGEDLPSFEEHAQKQWPDESERARVLFSMFGVLQDIDWSAYHACDSALSESLPNYAKYIPDLLRNHADDPRIMEGVARWTISRGRLLTIPDFPLLVKWGFSHPVADNRLLLINRLDSETGERYLLNFLQNPPHRREGTPTEKNQPEAGAASMLQYKSLASVHARDREIAALLLSERNCLKARPTIEQLHNESTGDARKHYETALRNFKEIPKALRK